MHFLESFLNGLLFTGTIGVAFNFIVALYFYRKTYNEYEVKDLNIFTATTYFFLFIVIVGVIRFILI